MEMHVYFIKIVELIKYFSFCVKNPDNAFKAFIGILYTEFFLFPYSFNVVNVVHCRRFTIIVLYPQTKFVCYTWTQPLTTF